MIILYDNSIWYVGHFQVDNGQVDFSYLNSIRKVTEETDISFPEHISGFTCSIAFQFYTQHLYRESSCAYWGM